MIRWWTAGGNHAARRSRIRLQNHQLVLFEVLFFFLCLLLFRIFEDRGQRKTLENREKAAFIASNHLFKRFRYRRKAGTIQLNTTSHSKLCIVMLMLHGSQNIVNYFRITFSFSDCEKNRDTDCEMLFVRNYFNNHLVLH